MQIGGISKYVIEIHTKDDIVKAFNFVREKNLPFYFLGAGANTFGTDEGFSGAIILNKILIYHFYLIFLNYLNIYYAHHFL